MRVIGTVEKDPWKSGIYFRGGDVVRPLNGNWLKAPYPTRILKFYVPFRILPFISIKIGKYGMYVGFKCFGVDRHEYLNWMPKEDVYEGSNALTPSIRVTNS